MIFCRGCGHNIHESAMACPKCGAPNGTSQTTQRARKAEQPPVEIPEGVKGWSWGAFLLNWIWAIGNRTWIGLLVLVPVAGWVMLVMLGMKGREWAWKNNRWESLEHFNKVQKKWSFWGVAILVGVLVLAFISGIGMAIYEQQKATSRHERSDDFPLGKMDFATLDSRSSGAPYPLSPSINSSYERHQEDSHQVEQSDGGLYKWKSGWGQGVSEYSVEDGNGNGLHISCPGEGEGDEGAVSATAFIGGKSIYSGDGLAGFDVIVDGENYSNPFDTSCRVCAQNFPYFWQALRRGNNISLAAKGKTARIPSNGIDRVLPSLESKENSCRVAW